MASVVVTVVLSVFILLLDCFQDSFSASFDWNLMRERVA